MAAADADGYAFIRGAVDAAGTTALTWVASPCAIDWGVSLSEAEFHHLLIADDHPLFRGALREAVNGLFDRAEIGEAGTFEEVTERLERGGDVDLILLDLRM